MNPILADLETRLKALEDKNIDRWSYISEVMAAYKEAMAIAKEAIAVAEEAKE